MATILGSFSGISTTYNRPYIVWSYSQSIAGNYTDVTAELRFARYTNGLQSFNLNASGGSAHTATGVIDTDSNGAVATFDLRSPHTDISVRTRTVRVPHNADGTKTAYIGYSGDTHTSLGTYNFGQTVTLPTIPREAYVTNTVDFTIGNNIPLTITNAGNMYVKVKLYVNGTLIKTVNAGQVTSYTITPTSGENNSMYAQLANVTSASMYVRLDTYSDSGYTTQVGGDRDQTGTVSIDQTTNKPTFTTFTLANVDKSIAVVDKYGNTLITSSTATLLGSSSKFIKSYSKVRATVAAANKMVALNSATADKYRYTNNLQQVEASYSTSDVTLDLDNVDLNSFTVSAFDSRGLSTAVTNTMSVMADYSTISIFGLTLTRDNGVDAPVTLHFDGQFWKKYFSSNTTSNPGSGVLNTIVAEYRYKPSTDAWAAQTWHSITPTSDSAGVISFDDYIDGDLGASGFDPDSSFTIEVRVYDKLSQMIIEGTLSVGTPLMHQTKAGVAIKAKYDAIEGGSLQVDGYDIMRLVLPVGSVIPYAGESAPNGFLIADGSAVSRSTYSELFAAIAPSKGNFTVTIASPAVVTLTGHGMQTGDAVYLTTTGALPTGLSANTLYYVIFVGSNSFNLASSLANAIAGTKINTSGSQSGTHSLHFCPFGLGDGSSTFNIPNLVGKVPVGMDNSASEFKALGVSGGEKTHTLTVAELAAHTHTNHDPQGTSGGVYGLLDNASANSTGTRSTQSTGGDAAHNNLQPYLSLNFIIRY